MSLGLDLGTFDAVMIIGVSIPALIIAFFIGNRKLRTLAFLLAGFLLLHGLYHATAVLGFYYGNDALQFISIGVAQPLSYLVLLILAYELLRLGEASK